MEQDGGAQVRRGLALAGQAGLGALAMAGLWLLYSRAFVNHEMPLTHALDADRIAFPSPCGVLSFYADDRAEGRPLVLIHSVNAAASAYEMRPLFEAFRRRRPVFVLDLPGFGFSERSPRTYTPELYRDAILELLQRPELNGRAADVVALSLSCEFAAMAAVERPELVHTLTFISPTGLPASGRRAGRSNEKMHSVRRNLSHPLWSQALYDLLTSKPSLLWSLKKHFHGRVDRGLLSYHHRSAHQPGATHAPWSFVAGELFHSDIVEEGYLKLRQPVLVLYDRDPNVSFDRLAEILDSQSNWRAVRIASTRGLPHFERTHEVVATIGRFLEQHAMGSAAVERAQRRSSR